MVLNGIKISRLFIESGLDLQINEKITIKHPHIRDIISLGPTCEEDYWTFVYSIICDPYQNMVWLFDDYGIDYEKVDNFDVFCLQMQRLNHNYKENQSLYDQIGFSPTGAMFYGLSLFIAGEHNKFQLVKDYHTEEMVIIDPDDDLFRIDRKAFNTMVSFIEMIHCISLEDQIHPDSEGAKKILLKQMRKKQKKMLERNDLSEKDEDVIGSIIASVVYGGNGSITPFNVMDLSIYQLLIANKTTHKKFNIDHLMNGVYAGTVKSESIKDKDLSWAD